MPIEKICEFCGKPYLTKPSHAQRRRYCSYECSIVSRDKKVTKICERCGKQFRVSPSMADRYRYCSIECRKASPIFRNCEVCGASFQISTSRKETARYCSVECYNKAGRQGAPKGEKVPRKIISCLHCGKKIRIRETATQKFCSHSCAAKYRNLGQLTRVPRVTLICETCKKPFKVRPQRAGKKRFCSQECFSKAPSHRKGKEITKRIIIHCQLCGKKMRLTPSQASRRKFCSFHCNGINNARKAALNKEPTDIEQLLMDELDSHNIDYEFQYRIGKWIADFGLPNHKIIIEADGIFWHSKPLVKIRDAKKDKYLRDKGWIVFRFLGPEIRESPSACIDKILTYISNL